MSASNPQHNTNPDFERCCPRITRYACFPAYSSKEKDRPCTLVKCEHPQSLCFHCRLQTIGIAGEATNVAIVCSRGPLRYPLLTTKPLRGLKGLVEFNSCLKQYGCISLARRSLGIQWQYVLPDG